VNPTLTPALDVLRFYSSKALLVRYVQSRSVTDVVGMSGSNTLLKFLRSSVFTHEDHFAAQYYHYTFSFEEYSNTCLEGTNNGLKHNADAVLPSMSIAKAGKCMINQDESKSSFRKRKAAAEFNTRPLYTDTQTSKHINDVAEDMLREQIELSENYSSVRGSMTKWLVCFTGERKRSEEKPSAVWPMPIFDRIRFVHINKDGGLQCSCGYANRNGIPDRHMIHVAMNYGINFEGFTHHNVHVRFWKAFNKFVAEGDPTQMGSAELRIRQKLRQARLSPTLIISVPGGFPPFEDGAQFSIGKNSGENFKGMDASSVFDHFQNRPGIGDVSSVMNYDTEMVNRAVAHMVETSSGHSVGLTQEMYTDADDDDGENEDVLDFDEQNETSFLAWQSTGGSSNNNSHQILYPRLKELASVYENNPERLREVAAVLDEWIQKGKAENAAMQQKPAGKMVSAVARNMHVKQHKHSKQIHHK
jgi:hypothetical protein